MVVPADSPFVPFFEYIWGNETGHAYLALKVAGNQHQFTQHFFEWPRQASEIVSFVAEKTADYEVYFAPALFEEPSAKKAEVKGAHVVWVEFDGNTPTDLG